MNRLLIALIPLFLLSGLYIKLHHYSHVKKIESNIKLLDVTKILLNDSRYNNVQIFNMTQSNDLEAISVYDKVCRSHIYLTDMPNHAEWIRLWENYAKSHDFLTSYVMGEAAHGSYPVWEHWQALLLDKIHALSSKESAQKRAVVFALSSSNNCDVGNLRALLKS
jgi:hypothetical protein